MTMESFIREALPTAPEAATPLVSTQIPFQNLHRLAPPPSDKPLLFPSDINNVPAGTSITFQSEAGIPEKWIISIRPGAGIRVSIFNGPNPSGIPYRLGGGGKLKLPATSEYVSLTVEVGSAAAFGTVVAVRGVPDFDIDAGDVA